MEKSYVHTSSSDVSEMPKLVRPMSESVSSSSLNRLAYARCLMPLLGSRYVNSWPIISISLASGTWCWMRLVMLSMSPGRETEDHHLWRGWLRVKCSQDSRNQEKHKGKENANCAKNEKQSLLFKP